MAHPSDSTRNGDSRTVLRLLGKNCLDKGMGELSGVRVIILIGVCVMSMYTLARNQQTVPLKWVYLIGCKAYLNTMANAIFSTSNN